MRTRWSISIVWLCLWESIVADRDTSDTAPPNFAVIVSTSRYWFNYRHHTNALQLYQFLKHHGGYHDDHIVLLLADDTGIALNPRNPVKNQIYNTASTRHGARHTSVYTDTTLVDVRGEDVTVEHFLNILTGHDADRLLYPVPPSPRTARARGNLLVYLTGHGGDSFLKFRDTEELTAAQLASVLSRLSPLHFGRILVVADTCQAFTLGRAILSSSSANVNANANANANASANIPHVTVIGSARLGESSYAHQGHAVLGLAVIEKYTHYMLHHLSHLVSQSQRMSWTKATLYQALVQPYSHAVLGSHVEIGSTVAGGANQTLSQFWVQPSPLAPHRRRHVGRAATVTVGWTVPWSRLEAVRPTPLVRRTDDADSPRQRWYGGPPVSFATGVVLWVGSVVLSRRYWS